MHQGILISNQDILIRNQDILMMQNQDILIWNRDILKSYQDILIPHQDILIPHRDILISYRDILIWNQDFLICHRPRTRCPGGVPRLSLATCFLGLGFPFYRTQGTSGLAGKSRHGLPTTDKTGTTGVTDLGVTDQRFSLRTIAGLKLGCL